MKLAQEKININIKIAERTYPLLVLPEDEAKVRAAVDHVNSTLKDLMSKYDGRDMQDYMTMYILLMMSQQLNATPTTAPDFSWLHQSLQELEQNLDHLLS